MTSKSVEKAPRCPCGRKTVPTIVKGYYLCLDHRLPELKPPPPEPYDPSIKYPAGYTPEQCADYRKSLK